jgi:NIMA (never in mitosis gene a)-related kinase 2
LFDWVERLSGWDYRNILKDLQHEHIVRYHDRHVDRDAGILYIIMEYCGGGDLSTVIKQSAKQGRPIPEDVIWNYFMQILLALCHCHHPNGAGTKVVEASKRPQILHRDLKPDNGAFLGLVFGRLDAENGLVFLDESNNVKLGDFGLSKALPHASFANTYVGVGLAF